ncbi:MAG: bifunctional UDP-N-acetylglucosamine diphosphorylase/glucosamine-1-phosphate N-acetyltransferase GlmU [Actinomycetota bacterium]|nr:bifunctional UDP-N-acetylglucosamine diphosphorylase/glucosamine-1-phosphate N-acetyltransferase GlmU [Actinomycetota bacterium]
MTDSLAAIVMAAGLGTRMKSALPKHLHPLLGRRLVDWSLEAVRPLSPAPLVLVTSPQARGELASSLDDGVDVAVQEEPRGTGDAVAAAKAELAGFEGDVLVVPGDSPLLTPAVLEELVEEHRRERAAVTLLSVEADKPLPYGRILRDETGSVRRIVEERDATPEERAVRELNASVYVFSARDLWWALQWLEADNVQGELYLTDTIRHLVDDGRRVGVRSGSDPTAVLGVNTRAELADAAAVLRTRILTEHMLAGVTILDPATTWVDPDVVIEPDAVVHPFTVLRGRTVVGREAHVGPHVVAVDAAIGARVVVGPFCSLRPGTVLEEGAKAGTFVEIKSATVGKRAKVPHLSYIGDAEIGEDSNIGAGAITANYRAERYPGKQRTVIGRNVHTGSDNVFVAPLEIGDNAWVGAGSTITENVPPGALAIARARQVNKEDYDDRRRKD